MAASLAHGSPGPGDCFSGGVPLAPLPRNTVLLAGMSIQLCYPLYCRYRERGKGNGG